MMIYIYIYIYVYIYIYIYIIYIYIYVPALASWPAFSACTMINNDNMII
jgi:hypothetical protein